MVNYFAVLYSDGAVSAPLLRTIVTTPGSLNRKSVLLEVFILNYSIIVAAVVLLHNSTGISLTYTIIAAEFFKCRCLWV